VRIHNKTILKLKKKKREKMTVRVIHLLSPPPMKKNPQKMMIQRILKISQNNSNPKNQNNSNSNSN
jgi:hypothetical protein